MTDIFVYGVLMYADIREAIFGCDYETTNATLHGYSRKTVKDLPYPAIIEDENDEVNGFVLIGVSLSDTTLLDKFEDEYERKLVQVETEDGIKFVNTYVPKQGELELTEENWNPDEFVYVEFYLETVIPEFFSSLQEA